VEVLGLYFDVEPLPDKGLGPGQLFAHQTQPKQDQGQIQKHHYEQHSYQPETPLPSCSDSHLSSSQCFLMQLQGVDAPSPPQNLRNFISFFPLHNSSTFNPKEKRQEAGFCFCLPLKLLPPNRLLFLQTMGRRNRKFPNSSSTSWASKDASPKCHSSRSEGLRKIGTVTWGKDQERKRAKQKPRDSGAKARAWTQETQKWPPGEARNRGHDRNLDRMRPFGL
jgi:hypothetical protein